ncbi:4268_t:CDS:10 [Acaulospora colombiana]|uniref:4268_t:CDS:1 n=1 Tax=Acaulospora colombiana TaxID=27376 RepID=A0ACA9K146_9GLOM|nr:4268_t:CDS:10 [Acaulospora colombiana]
MEEKIKQRRVKVYQLSRESEWLDKGTGFCSCLCNETKDDAYIVVHSEEDSASVLLHSQIFKDQEYQKQQDTLVVWTEPNGMDLALSFQEAEGCTEICDFISEIKNHMNQENSEDVRSSPFDSEIISTSIKLPDPTLSNLQEIELLIKSASRSTFEKEKLALFITQAIVKIKDKAIEAKIHETFRLQYLKDVVFARAFDDPTIISSLIFFNHVDISKHISQDDEFLTELFNILNEEGEDSTRKRDVVMFVQQLCSIAKSIHFSNRKDLYKSLAKHGLFQIFEHSLVDKDPSVRTAGGEILASILDTDASIIRSYIVKQDEEKKKTLADVIIERFIQDEDMGVKAQCAESLRFLLDMNAGLSEIGFIVPPESLNLLNNHDDDVDQFLNVFYEEPIKKIVKPILDLPELEKDDVDEDEEAYFNTSDDEDSGISGETAKAESTLAEESKDGSSSENDSSVGSKVDSAKAPKSEVESYNVGKVGLVDYPDEDDGNNEDVKKDITDQMTLDTPRTAKTPQTPANESSLSPNGTSTKKGGLKILRSSQTLRPKLKKARME